MIKGRTKSLLADTLQEMLILLPLSKIRVTDICLKADVSKQVFYYHFKDKYDLAAWIFDQDYREIYGDRMFEHAPFETLADALKAKTLEMTTRLWRKREFYNRLFSEHSQNSIYDYMHERSMDELYDIARFRLGRNDLDTATVLQLKHYAYGSINIIVEWLKGGICASPKEITDYEFSVMPKFLTEESVQTADVNSSASTQP